MNDSTEVVATMGVNLEKESITGRDETFHQDGDERNYSELSTFILHRSNNLTIELIKHHPSVYQLFGGQNFRRGSWAPSVRRSAFK